jgi:hypothetical protein
MARVTEILRSFQPISLEEAIEQEALQRRVDAKYLAHWESVANLLAALVDSFRVLEIDGLRVFG